MLIAGVNEEVIPLHRRNAEFSSDFDDEEYETRERALFYVGATRARRTLTISSFGAESPLLISQ
jgi:superfamily I DNA/RNA helicase